MATQLILCSNGLEIFRDSLIVNLIIFYKGWNLLLTAVFPHDGEKYLDLSIPLRRVLHVRTSSNIWRYYKLISLHSGAAEECRLEIFAAPSSLNQGGPTRETAEAFQEDEITSDGEN